MAELEVVTRDITKLAVDAIVNAADPLLLGGGGVDGAIHRAAGPDLVKFCRGLGGCEPGSAKASPGFRLPAKWIFHAVGPIWHGGTQREDELLAGCYRTCLDLAREHSIESIAFSAVSTGVYGFPRERAARIAVATVQKHLAASGVHKVLFCCFNEATEAVYREILG